EKRLVENARVRATCSNKGAVLSSLVLLQHTDDHKKPLELVRQSPGSSGKPLAVEFPGNPELTRRVADAFYAVEKPSERSVRFSYAVDAVAATKEIRF